MSARRAADSRPAITLDATAAQMGLLTAAGLAPHLLFSLFAGVLVDRRSRRRRFLVAADLGRAAMLATVPLAAAFDALTLARQWFSGPRLP